MEDPEEYGKALIAQMAKERLEAFEKLPIKTIGEVIDLLERQPSKNLVKLDFIAQNPSRLISYRGYYEDICITYNWGEPEMTVAWLLASFKFALGQELIGYKGGEFTMTNKTWVWVAPYGDCGRMLTDIIEAEDQPGITLICTQEDED